MRTRTVEERAVTGGTVDDRALYRPPTDPVLIDVPAFDFVMIDGTGDPNVTPEFTNAMGALYAASYPVVITLKRAGRSDLKVKPLEGLWWAEDMSAFDPQTANRAAWRWTMMIRQPDDVPADLYERVFAKMANKVGQETADRVRIERFEEGLSAQLMHLGPYSEEGPNIVRLHDFIAAEGLQVRGRHHEIYLGDPRRSAPEKLKTIIRQPVRRHP